MATIYHPAEKNYTRKAGDTSGIGFYVPTEINLTGLTVRFQMREQGSDRLKLQKLSTVSGEITVTLSTNHVWIAFTNADVKLLNAKYNYDIEAFTPSTLAVVQTLQTGTITFNKEFSHE